MRQKPMQTWEAHANFTQKGPSPTGTQGPDSSAHCTTVPPLFLSEQFIKAVMATGYWFLSSHSLFFHYILYILQSLIGKKGGCPSEHL